MTKREIRKRFVEKNLWSPVRGQLLGVNGRCNDHTNLWRRARLPWRPAGWRDNLARFCHSRRMPRPTEAMWWRLLTLPPGGCGRDCRWRSRPRIELRIARMSTSYKSPWTTWFLLEPGKNIWRLFRHGNIRHAALPVGLHNFCMAKVLHDECRCAHYWKSRQSRSEEDQNTIKISTKKESRIRSWISSKYIQKKESRIQLWISSKYIQKKESRIRSWISSKYIQKKESRIQLWISLKYPQKKETWVR